ncbi:hypothetical protein L226DRAFT_596808, partial [Lentinus tigrinus ALCF2SS1-7]|uniref:uncharacterized protein n=1 Tax=Lentinus tigrinus ALCF2SS1-7 TaxID=1328758 RepID=UPI001165FA46
PFARLRSCCTRCRDWTAPAQAGLYSDITLYVHADFNREPVTISRERKNLLARTMRTSPHLRVLLRSLSITEGRHINDSCLDWLRLIPPHTLRRLEYKCSSPESFFLASLMDAPAVKTVISLIVWKISSMDMLKAVLVPGLESLSLTVDRALDGEFELGELPPKLTKLAILCPWHYFCPAPYKGPQAPKIVRSYGSRIIRPFLDELVLHCTRLEHLAVVAGTYTERLFQRLPSSVKVLEFVGNQEPIPFEDALIDAIARAGRKTIALSRIVVLSYEYELIGKREYARLAEACVMNDVQFEYVEEMSG